MLVIKVIKEDRIPGTPQEQLFLALAEDREAVLAVGKIPNGRELISAAGIYSIGVDGSYQGWTYTKGHAMERMNGLHFHKRLESEVIRIFPTLADYVAFVPIDFSKETADIKELEEIFTLILAPVLSKKQAN